MKLLNSLTESQRDRVIRTVTDMVNMNQQLADTAPHVCPKCGASEGFVKAGFEGRRSDGKKRDGNPYARKQIYKCKACDSRFVYDAGSMTHNLKITQDDFIEICKDTIQCVPLKKTAARLNRSVQCIFENRHKFLCLLEKAL